MVVGEDPGPAKLDKARKYNIPEIDEDQLLDMILTKSGMKPKYSKTNSEESCDSGKGNSAANSFEESPKKRNLEIEQKIDHKTKKDEAIGNSKPNLKKLEVSNNIKSKNIDDECDAHSKKDLLNKSVEKAVTKIKKQITETIEEKHKKESIETSLLKTEPSKLNPKELETDTVKSPSVNGQKHDQGEMLSWADKYKPHDIKSIIGQQEGSSNMNKLKTWLANWYWNQQPERRKKIPKPSPWAKNDDGAYYKAALLSGPPGVGKKYSCYPLTCFNID